MGSRLTGMAYPSAKAITYTYDADSNRITKTNVLRANGTNGAYIETYTYDRLSDLNPSGGGEVTQEGRKRSGVSGIKLTSRL